VNLNWLILLRIIMGAAFASCCITVGGISNPWLQAMGTQLLSFCISVGIDLRYRSIYQGRRVEEAALAAAAAGPKEAATVFVPQVGGCRQCASPACRALLPGPSGMRTSNPQPTCMMLLPGRRDVWCQAGVPFSGHAHLQAVQESAQQLCLQQQRPPPAAGAAAASAATVSSAASAIAAAAVASAAGARAVGAAGPAFVPGALEGVAQQVPSLPNRSTGVTAQGTWEPVGEQARVVRVSTVLGGRMG